MWLIDNNVTSHKHYKQYYNKTIPLEHRRELAHIAEKPIEESGINNHRMDTANNQEEKEANERGVVVVSNTDVDPGTVMVHLLHTSNSKETPY